ncbi:hypothetical protein [Spiroplasma endosymbiont of Nebria brevicollis]|uniref:hypothetical protein n=1 Tax=Spiroplasma endosymbiont of Nebria brevicollis TaxID=3066284 RepID=UPI00313D50A6
MDNNLIPKFLNQQHVIIFKNFTFYDLGLAIAYFLVAVLTTVGLVMILLLYRVMTAITIFTLLSLTLVTNNRYNLKIYQILIWVFRFRTKKKNFHQSSKTSNTSFLMPYAKLVNNFIESERLEGGLKWYITAIEIKGFNISTLSPEEQLLKCRKLQDVFKFLDCHLSLVKIDQPININDWITYCRNHVKMISYKKVT